MKLKVRSYTTAGWGSDGPGRGFSAPGLETHGHLRVTDDGRDEYAATLNGVSGKMVFVKGRGDNLPAEFTPD